MKYFVKKSVLLLLVVLAFCACDNSNDNGEVIQPNEYTLNIAGKVESKDNYRLFPAASVHGWYKMDIVPVDTKDGKPVATYDVFMHQNIPSSLVHSKMYFCEDLTEKYRQKFPNEDIHAVVRRLVLSYVKGGDNINE